MDLSTSYIGSIGIKEGPACLYKIMLEIKIPMRPVSKARARFVNYQILTIQQDLDNMAPYWYSKGLCGMSKAKVWTIEEINWFIKNYPKIGRMECVRILGRPEGSIRWKASELGLKQDRDSDFYKDWQARAATSKIGKKRPAQALVMKKLHAEGKLLKNEIQIREMGERAKKRIAENGHPRGALGMKHSDKVKNNMSKYSKKRWEDPEHFLNSEDYKQQVSDMKCAQHAEKHAKGIIDKSYSRSKSGKREDLNNRFFRSSWEANYARYLNFLLNQKQIYKWEYEADIFWFLEIKRGTRSYTPDFKIWDKETSEPYYVEVKGWMDAKSKTKLSRMTKYYANVRVDLVQKKEYTEIKNKMAALLPGWEN